MTNASEEVVNWQQLIISLVDSLAWPVAVVVLVLIFRVPLQNSLRGLTRIRYGSMEMNFEKEIQKLGDRAQAAGYDIQATRSLHDPDSLDSTQIVNNAKRLAWEFPGPAVGLAWTAVEHESSQAVGRLDNLPAYKLPVNGINLLNHRGYLDADTYGFLIQMRRLRNSAVHASRDAKKITDEDAWNFISLTEAIIQKLGRLGS